MYLGNRIVYFLTAKDGEHMIEPEVSAKETGQPTGCGTDMDQPNPPDSSLDYEEIWNPVKMAYVCFLEVSL